MKKNVFYGFLLLLSVVFVSCSNDAEFDDQSNALETQLVTSNRVSAVPDYKPTVFSGNSVVMGIENVDFRVFVAEYNTVDNDLTDSKVVLLVKKKPGLSVTFNPNLTTLNGQAVSNNNWTEISETANNYRFKYTGNNGVFPGGTGHFLGLNAMLDCQGVGDVKLIVKIKGGVSGGQTNISNDKDIDYLICQSI